MTIEQLLPELSGLSRIDKLKVMQRLVHELAAEESVPAIDPNRQYDVWSPYQADEAAEVLLTLLQSTESDDSDL